MDTKSLTDAKKVDVGLVIQRQDIINPDLPPLPNFPKLETLRITFQSSAGSSLTVQDRFYARIKKAIAEIEAQAEEHETALVDTGREVWWNNMHEWTVTGYSERFQTVLSKIFESNNIGYYQRMIKPIPDVQAKNGEVIHFILANNM